MIVIQRTKLYPGNLKIIRSKFTCYYFTNLQPLKDVDENEAMAPKNKAKIDVEWAESLVGLRLCVPDSWWVGYKTRDLNDGKVCSFDVETQKWMFVLDSDEATDCPMACSAIHQCVDPEVSTLDCHIVPPDPVLEGVEEDSGVNKTIHTVTHWIDGEN